MSCAILILHGWGASSKSWLKVREFLEKNNYRVYVPDLPGFGKTPKPSEVWALDDYVEWVKDFIEKNQLSDFLLMGHSFGGRIAIKFTAKYPEKLKGLILCAAAGVGRKQTLRNFLFLILAKTGKAVFALPILNRFRSFSQRVIYFLAGSRDYLSAEGIMKEIMKKVIKEDLSPYLSQIKAPTLIIWGKKDKITPISSAYLLKKKIENSTLKIIPEGDHNLNLKFPEELAKIISGK